MEINEFIKKFSEILDDTDASVLTPDTNFRELEEWSSLSAWALTALADDEFDAELSGNELRKVNTIQELYDLLNSK